MDLPPNYAAKFQKPAPTTKRKPPHPLSACVDEIEKAGLFSANYGRGFWLRRLSLYQKHHRIEAAALYTRLLGLLKQVAGMDPRYSKGGTLTNKLKF